MTASDTKRCDNLACMCTVASDDVVCAPYCDTPAARDLANLACDCGHDGCAKAIAAQVHGGGEGETVS